MKDVGKTEKILYKSRLLCPVPFSETLLALLATDEDEKFLIGHLRD